MNIYILSHILFTYSHAGIYNKLSHIPTTDSSFVQQVVRFLHIMMIWGKHSSFSCLNDSYGFYIL